MAQFKNKLVQLLFNCYDTKRQAYKSAVNTQHLQLKEKEEEWEKKKGKKQT